MAKKLSELYEPKPQGEKDFVAKHVVKKTTDKSPATKDDKLFKATNVKTYNRAPRHGNNPGEDVKANDGTTGVNDQKTVKAIAPYTVEDFSEDDIDALLDIVSELMENISPIKPVPAPDKEPPAVSGGYNKVAVDNAIKNNRTGKIGKSEAKKIHALLKGWRGK